MIRIAPQRTRGYEAAVEQFCSLVIERVAQAEPGDVLHNVTGSELVAAMEGVLAMLPHLHGTFAIDQWLRV
jgi:hypothetical protein